MEHCDPNIEGDKRQLATWIREAKAGSPTALSELLRACHDYLTRLARQSIIGPLRVKFSPSDLVQETSLDAHRDFADFRGERLDELLAWLKAILEHNAAAAGRHYEVVQKRRLSREEPLEGYARRSGELVDDAPSPRSLLATIEERDSVEQALERLTPDQRTAVLLRNREHCSFVEIGTRMQRSADAARKLWFRAIERLQQELKTADDSS